MVNIVGAIMYAHYIKLTRELIARAMRVTLTLTNIISEDYMDFY